MVAPNTHLSPFQHHSRRSSTTRSSFKNYSRIQAEAEREGFEVHKENLLSQSLSRKGKPSAIGEWLEAGPRLTPRKTGLQSFVPTNSGTILHGQGGQLHEHKAVGIKLIASCEKTQLFGSGTHTHPSIRAASSSLSGLIGEETKDADEKPSEMLPHAYTPITTCLATTSLQQKGDSLSPCIMVEHEEIGNPLSNFGSVEADVGNDAGDMKGLKSTSIAEDGTSMRLFGAKYLEPDFTSRCQKSTTSNVGTGNVGAFDLEAKSRGSVASLCGTSDPAQLSEAPSATGLKLLATSVHVQMPKALSTFSEGEPSLPLPLEHFQQLASDRTQKTSLYNDSYGDADWGKFLALSATPIANDVATANAKVFPFQQRFKQLQAFLKQCDEADQNECWHALRPLSAATRSGYAVELETRAIRLSLEEGKEMKRMRLLNVLGKISDRGVDAAGATPQGPKLPAPGAAVKIKSVPQ